MSTDTPELAIRSSQEVLASILAREMKQHFLELINAYWALVKCGYNHKNIDELERLLSLVANPHSYFCSTERFGNENNQNDQVFFITGSQQTSLSSIRLAVGTIQGNYHGALYIFDRVELIPNEYKNLFPVLFCLPNPSPNIDMANFIANTIALHQILGTKEQSNSFNWEIDRTKKTLSIETKFGRAEYYVLAFKDTQNIIYLVKVPNSDHSISGSAKRVLAA
ncbi:MAG: hypothetical protein NZM26_02305 [Patescibacteria group bacterium]|nr:hypothetical protein [Patescibacteria group bacterium]